MPAQLSIQFEPANALYQPGQRVRGSVQLAAQSDLHPRGVTVRAYGKEATSLGMNAAMNALTHPFDLSFSVWSPTIESDGLRAGAHTFPFEFALPLVLPPTFDGELTTIDYRVEVKVNLPMHTDLHLEKPFSVSVPPLVDADKSIRATATSPRGLTLELNLKTSGFYPDEHVSGELLVIGSGSETIKQAAIDLVSREKGEAHDFVDRAENVRVRAEIDPTQLRSGKPFPIDIPIPSDAGPSFVGQHSAQTHIVRVQIHPGSGRPLMTEALIRIGTR